VVELSGAAAPNKGWRDFLLPPFYLPRQGKNKSAWQKA